MMHIFICPVCKKVRMVSRFRSAHCMTCGGEMLISEIPYLRWTEMSEEERDRALKRQLEAKRQ